MASNKSRNHPGIETIAFPGSPSTLNTAQTTKMTIVNPKAQKYLDGPVWLAHPQYAYIINNTISSKNLSARFNGWLFIRKIKLVIFFVFYRGTLIAIPTIMRIRPKENLRYIGFHKFRWRTAS